MTESPTELFTSVRRWLEQDPDAETRSELSTLLNEAAAGDADALAALHDRFDTRLAFGTAGLRGEIAAGPNRMNRVLVAQAAAGLAAYLASRAAGATPSVVVGYDGRKNSDVFARDTVEIMAGAGIRAMLLPRMLPTPVLAFAVRHLAASAGVMVTASHNPANDNGYKVYLGDEDGGSQIVPPADDAIATRILSAAQGSITDLPRSTSYSVAAETVIDAYIAETAAVAARTGLTARRDGKHARRAEPAESGTTRSLRVVYTAMHGVGWEVASRTLVAAGFALPFVVPEQIEPDPSFPTVAFPNPEEPGALDRAFAAGREHQADLIVANDPDADRLAVAIPDPAAAEGFRQLTGNEVGALLGWRAAELAQRAARGDTGAVGTLVCSIVSSPALKAVALDYGLDFAETLTGFKWVSRAPGIIFGFEEALGYLVNPDAIRDKDGISAAVAFLQVARALHQEGLTVTDQLDLFAERFGYFASDQISIRAANLDDIRSVMARLRSEPPSRIGAVAVSRIDDLSGGFEGLPPSDVLRFVLEDGSRAMVRPSGTEPKLKVYLDASSDQGSVAHRRGIATKQVDALRRGILPLVS